MLVALVAAVLRRWRLVIAALLVYPLKIFVEKMVVKEIVHRGRPGQTEPEEHQLLAQGVGFVIDHDQGDRELEQPCEQQEDSDRAPDAPGDAGALHASSTPEASKA